MLKSLLFHVDSEDRMPCGVQTVVELARTHRARVRGLTIVDTRRVAQVAASCESAVYAVMEAERLERRAERQDTAITELAMSCLSAGVDFDVRRLRGDLMELLPREARFYDLVATSCPGPSEANDRDADWNLCVRDITELALRGAQPLLVLRGAGQRLERILLAYDGTLPAERAIKSFLYQQLFPQAEIRLLGIGRTEQAAKDRLQEMAEFVLPRRADVELGFVCGTVKASLVPYIEKWDADLIVLGMSRRNRMLQRVWGNAAVDALRQTNAAAYISG
ncbi:MAG: universal stress protein [Planctomycetaceae bacterium]|nr:universal stress protein [Planctomycetaceae bacterium]